MTFQHNCNENFNTRIRSEIDSCFFNSPKGQHGFLGQYGMFAVASRLYILKMKYNDLTSKIQNEKKNLLLFTCHDAYALLSLIADTGDYMQSIITPPSTPQEYQIRHHTWHLRTH